MSQMTIAQAPEHLVHQVATYCEAMITLKKMAVLSQKGPTDIPSLLLVRYGADPGTKADELGGGEDENNALMYRDETTGMYERLIDLTEYAGPGVAPGGLLYSALMDFITEYEGAVPYTVALVADGVAVIDAENPDWKEFISQPKNDNRGLHDIFCEEAQASKWITECITVFLMDMQGHMVSTSRRYGYGDDTFPPKPQFEPSEIRYEGMIFEKTKDWVQEQRVVSQIVLFFARMEQEDSTKGLPGDS